MDNHEFLISKTPQGFVASSTSSPYFCFVENTEQEALDTVKRAIAFYKSARDEQGVGSRMPESKAISVTPLVPGRRINTRELMVA